MVKLKANSKKILRVPITLSKDIQHKSWVVPRAKTLDFIPRLSCEEECDIIIDGISAKARLTILFRLSYRRKEEPELAKYLDDITSGNDAEIDMQIILDEKFEEFTLVNSSYEDISSLNQKFLDYRQSSEDMKNNLIEINEELSNKINNQNDLIEDLKKDNIVLSRYVGDLEEKNDILEKRIKYLSE